MFGALVPVFSHGGTGGGPPPVDDGLPVTITIDGVDRTLNVIELGWRSGLGTIGVADFVTEDPAGLWIPVDGDEVTIVVDGVTVWAGQITEVETTWLGWNAGYRSEVSAQDWNHLPQREPFNGIVAADLLFDILSDLVSVSGALGVQGISLHPSQMAGSTVGPIAVPWKDAEWLLRQLALLTNTAVWIDPQKRVRLWSPGDITSGVTFSLANGNVIACSHKVHRFDYRNQQWVVFGPTGVQDATDKWSGDGVTQIFDLHYEPAAHPSPIYVNSLPFPVGVFGVDSMEWVFEANAGSGAVKYGRFRHTGTAVGAGTDNIQATFPSNFPNAVYVEDGGEVVDHGRYGRVDFAPETIDHVEAKALGDALIRKNLPRPTEPVIVTYDLSIFPGMTAQAVLPSVGLNAEILIHTVEVSAEKEGTGLRGTAKLSCFGNDWRGDLTSLWLRLINGDESNSGGGSTVTTGSGGGGGGTTTVVTGGVVRILFGGTIRSLFTAADQGATSGVWFDAPDGHEWPLTGSQIPGSFFVRVHLRTRGGVNATIRARLFDETNNVDLGQSADVTVDAWTYVGFFATLASTEAIVKLQLRVTGSAALTAETGYWNATGENRP